LKVSVWYKIEMDMDGQNCMYLQARSRLAPGA
jgi:hypothetical protein